MIQFVVENKAVILGVLWGLSEALASIPAVKANSVFQLIVNGLKQIGMGPQK